MPVCRTRNEAAKELGITPRVLSLWAKEAWFPADATETGPRKTRINWDTDKIAAARDVQGRKGSELDEVSRQLAIEQKRAKLEALQIQTRQKQREEQAELGNVLRRDELTSAIAECIVIARDGLLNLPKQLARLLPKKHRRTILDEGEREVRRILDAFAERVQRTEPPRTAT